jgi:arylsulfatase A-like enzyme
MSPEGRVRNVILIISDTLRRDCVGVYGSPPWFADRSPTFTPHLDRFAQRCVLFDRAFSSSFPTVPLRNDIVTGRATFTYKQWAPLQANEPTLQEALNEAGIVTALVADTPHPFAPGFNYQRGFQSWELIRGQEHDRWKSHPRDPALPCAPEKLRSPMQTVKQYLRNVHDRRGEEDYFVARTMRAAIRWLEDNHTAPFFLYVDTFDPHEPWDPPSYFVERYDPGYEGEEVIYPRYDRCGYLSNAELNHCRALFAGEVTLVDRWVGALLERIESLGLLESTAVLFVSDHGFYLGEHGYIGKSLITPAYQQTLPLYPEVCRIPFTAWLPDAVARRTPALAQPLDLMPTVLDLLGLDSPDYCAGHSLRSVLEGDDTGPRGVAIASPTLSAPGIEVPHPTRRASVTDGEWLLVYGSQASVVETTETTRMVDSVTRQVRTLEDHPVQTELYHLLDDPGAIDNVIGRHETVARTLHGQLVEALTRAMVPEAHLRYFRSP